MEKKKEQEPVEWSEADDALLKEIVSFFKDGTVKLQHDLDLYAGFLENKFKSFRSQPHTVSKKDAIKFGDLEYERGVKDGIQSEKSRHWKPTE